MPTPPTSLTYQSASLRNLISNSRRQLSLDNSILKYPREIDEIPHKVLFKFTKRGFTQAGNTQRATNSSTMFLTLPVPGKIVDGTSVKISGTDLGLTGELIAGASSYLSGLDFTSVQGATASAGTVARDLVNSFQNTTLGGATSFAGELGRAGLQFFGANIINTVANNLAGINANAAAALAVGTGQILNPFTTAVFNGVNLRTFNFSWRFSPSTEDDSIKLEKIIKRLRAKSLPTVSPNNLFMEFPNEVEFTYLGMQNDTFTFPTAPCYITGMEVDRTAAGTPAFFAKTGAPAFVSISLNLLEIRPLVSKGDAEDNVITNATLTGVGQQTLVPPSSRSGFRSPAPAVGE
jgi:hypothetical protein